QRLPLQPVPPPGDRAVDRRPAPDSTDADVGSRGGAVTSLTVAYDAECGLCCAVAAWVSRQPQLVPVTCVPAGRDADELTVTADSGECWSGDDAWVMVLWALARHRHAAYRLASPALRP